MDIIDIMLAKTLTPQGQIDTYARRAGTAVQQANQAVAAIDSITEQTQANNEAAAEALSTANAAVVAASSAQEQVESALESLQTATTEQVDNEIDKLALRLTSTDTSANIATSLVMTTPSGTEKTAANINKLYKTTGNAEDGSMTQKAITAALALKADASTAATKTYVDQKIATIPSSGGTGGGISNLGSANAGKIVVVGDDGNIKAGEASEEAIIKALIKSGTYTADGTLGLIIDYENKSFERTQDAASHRAGTDFDGYAMFGGRMRCNVANNGTINAFYGDSNYREDGSNGQVMIYQPKFYYQRTFIKDEAESKGTTIRKESLILSYEERAGFKLHPLFKLADEELDYVLLPAFEGSIYDVSEEEYLLANESGVDFSSDMISSIAGAKPFNGINNTLNLEKIKTMASNRGEGWSVTTIEAESANQMLEMVEFGTMNGQAALEKGIVSVSVSGTDCSAITGSTSSLGNRTGAAAQTVIDIDGTQSTYSTAGQRAISYRGMENPWGNLWRVIGNLSVRGGSSSQGGVPYYNNIDALNFQLPVASSTWVSAMGYQNIDYDWVYLPIECSSSANSALPVGDSLWTMSALNGEDLVAIGGLRNSGESAGLFHYSADIDIKSNLRSFNGRIMFVPSKNSIYEANINKWRQHYGG